MRRFTVPVLLALVALISLGRPVVHAQNARDAEAALKAAAQQADVQGDLKGAIAAYQRLVSSQDKTVAARALLGMAECYQKLGDAQAANIYQQLIRDYGGQPEAVEARARLAGLRQPPVAGHRDSVAWSSSTTPGAVSNDGRWVAFVDRNGLSLHDLQSGTDRRVVPSGGSCDPDGDVAFSRDGSQLAYTCWIPKGLFEELWVASVSGSPATPPKKLLAAPDLEGGWHPNWTADGRAIVIALDRRSRTALGPYDTTQIAIVSTTDGSVRVLKTTKLVDDIVLENISLSPDDRWVAYDCSGPSGVDLALQPMDGGPEIPVLSGQSDARVVGWSPDGTRLLFTNARSGSRALYGQRITNGKLDGVAERLVPDLGPITALGVSALGSLYYVPESFYMTDVRVGEVDFGSGRVVTPPASISWSEGDISQAPGFSSDGTLLAYATSSPGWRAFAGRRLIIQSLDPSAREELPVHLTVDALRWAPDGKSLAVHGTETFEKDGFWTIDRATGRLTAIVLRDQTTSPSFYGWSPDSRTQFIGRRNMATKDAAIIARDATTGAEQVLFHAAVDQSGPDLQFSPDGRTVYYRRATGSAADLPFLESAFVARDLATGAEREFGRGQFGGVTLSPDGKYVATGSSDEATHSRAIILVPVAGGPVRNLIRVDLPANVLKGQALRVNPLGVVAFAPDGRSIVVEKSSGTTRVEQRELWWVPIEGSAPAVRLDVGPYTSFRISADNRHIAVTVPPPAGPTRSDVHVLEHFLPGK